MKDLRSQILKEIKILLEAKAEVLAKGTKAGMSDAMAVAQAAGKLEQEIGALKALGKDVGNLENIKNTIAAGNKKDLPTLLAQAKQEAERLKATPSAAAEAPAKATRSRKATTTLAKSETAEVKPAQPAAAAEAKPEAAAAAAEAAKPAEQAAAAAGTAEVSTRDFSQISDNDLKSMIYTGTMLPAEIEQAKMILAAREATRTAAPAKKTSIFKNFTTRLGGKWNKLPRRTKILIGLGAGVSAAGLITLGLMKKGEPLPTPGPGPTPSPGGGEEGPPAPPTPPANQEKFGKKGLSFKCTGDITADSIVAKYQRYVGAFPDGEFGRNTYALGQKKSDSKLPDTWAAYSKSKNKNENVLNICNWLKRSDKPWADLSGKIRKKIKKKVAPPTESTTETPNPEPPEETPSVDRGIPGGRFARTVETFEESWNKRLQTAYTNDIFERLVRSINNKKVI